MANVDDFTAKINIKAWVNDGDYNLDFDVDASVEATKRALFSLGTESEDFKRALIEAVELLADEDFVQEMKSLRRG